MGASSFARGWPIEYRDGQWVYSDQPKKAAIDDRPCRRCHRGPTLNGHDACLGGLAGVASACCGHGVQPAYTIYIT